MYKKAFTLVEMLMALLIISLILSASLPIITKRINEQTNLYSLDAVFPIGGIIIWGTDKALPDNTWLECNGQAIPNGIEYEEIRRIYGTNLPDYRGVFLRGYGSVNSSFSWSDNQGTARSVSTAHTSGAIGVVQADTMRKVVGQVGYGMNAIFTHVSGVFFGVPKTGALRTDYSIVADDFPYRRAEFDISRIVPVSNEIRPVNKAVRYIIKVRN